MKNKNYYSSYRHLFIFLLLAGGFLFFWTGKASAQTYYVANAGSDNCDGTSSTIGASGHCAWKTIAHVNAQAFQPGDSVFFNKGDTWREELIPPSSGSASGPSFTNLLASDIGNGPWTTTSAAVTAKAAAAPDQSMTAATFSDNTSNAEHFTNVYYTSPAAGTSYTFEAYVKPGTLNWAHMRIIWETTGYASISEANAWFNVAMGSVGTKGSGVTASISPAANGYYLVAITMTAPTNAGVASLRLESAPADNTWGYAGDGSVVLNMVGAQFGVAGLQAPAKSITFGAYGSGNDPVISGSDIVSNWTTEAPSNYDFTSDSNLQGYWNFENVWTDGTAKGNTLTLSATPPAFDNNAGEFIQGAYSSSYLKTSNEQATRTDANLSAGFPGKSGTTNTALTISLWARTTQASGGTNQGIISKGWNTTDAYSIGLTSSKIEFIMMLDGSKQTITANSASSYPYKAWVHIVGRLDPSTNKMELFINGVKQSASYTATSTAIYSTNTDPLRIGDDTSLGYFNGQMDEVSIFNRALSDSEINNLYNYGLAGNRNVHNLYYETEASQHNQVFDNGTRLNQVSTKGTMSQGSWWWDSADSRVYTRLNSDADPSAAIMEVSHRNYAVYTNAQSNLTFDSLNTANCDLDGFYVYNSNNLTVTNNVFAGNWRHGLNSYHNPTISANDNLTISHNISANNGACGMSPSQISNSEISYNTIYGNSNLYDDSSYQQYTGGIKLNPYSVNNIIEHNTVYGNGLSNPATLSGVNTEDGYGIWPDTVGANTIRYNLIYSNQRSGIRDESSSDQSIYSNIIYNNLDSGIQIAQNGDTTHNSANNLVYNNTLYGNAIGIKVYGTASGPSHSITGNLIENNLVSNSPTPLVCSYGGENDGARGSGNVYAYNDFGPESANFIGWGNGIYKSTYAAWESATGNCGSIGCSQSVQADPFFVSSSTFDFHLQSASPAIKAGANVGILTDYAGNSIYGLPDLGAYEYHHPQDTVGTDKIDIGAGARIYSDGKFENIGTASGMTANLSVLPQNSNISHWLDLSISKWDASGDYEKTWTENGDNLDHATQTIHAIGDLEPNKYYNIQIDSSPATNNITGATCNDINSTEVCQSDNDGKITFIYTGGYSTHIFDIQEGDNTGPITTATPAGGTYTSSQAITLTCDDNGGTGCNKTYCTTDGSDPTTSSNQYSTPITISSTTTLKFFSTDRDSNMEIVRSQIYTINPRSNSSSHHQETTVDLNLSHISYQAISPTEIDLTWRTNGNADETVRYGIDQNLKNKKSSKQKNHQHIIKLENLSPGTKYYFRAASDDGNQSARTKIYSLTLAAVETQGLTSPKGATQIRASRGGATLPPNTNISLQNTNTPAENNDTNNSTNNNSVRPAQTKPPIQQPQPQQKPSNFAWWNPFTWF